MKVNLPLQISDQLIGLDKDNFVRIDRVETMLTPLFTSRLYVADTNKDRLLVLGSVSRLH